MKLIADNASVLDIENSSRMELIIGIVSPANTTGALDKGIYDLTPTVDCYVKVHATDATGVLIAAGANGGYLHLANVGLQYRIAQGRRVGVIGATAGILHIHRTGDI